MDTKTFIKELKKHLQLIESYTDNIETIAQCNIIENLISKFIGETDIIPVSHSSSRIDNNRKEFVQLSIYDLGEE